MPHSEIEAIIRRHIGSTVTVTFGETTETVVVVSVDPDGFICRADAPAKTGNSADFWLAYGEVTCITVP